MVRLYAYIGIFLFVISSVGYGVYAWHYTPLLELQKQIKQKDKELKEVGMLMNESYMKLYSCEQSIIPEKIKSVVDALESMDENISIDVFDFSY